MRISSKSKWGITAFWHFVPIGDIEDLHISYNIAFLVEIAKTEIVGGIPRSRIKGYLQLIESQEWRRFVDLRLLDLLFRLWRCRELFRRRCRSGFANFGDDDSGRAEVQLS